MKNTSLLVLTLGAMACSSSTINVAGVVDGQPNDTPQVDDSSADSTSTDGQPQDGALSDGSDGAADSPDGRSSWDQCDGPGTCVLAHNACCSPCSTPTLSDFTAVNRMRTDDFRAFTCPTPPPGGCPDCATTQNPNLMAVCRTKSCNKIDLRKDLLSVCTADSQCTLRYAGCCETCTPSGAPLIALNSASRKDYTSQICAPTEACPACPAGVVYPPDRKAHCNLTTNHCDVLGG